MAIMFWVLSAFSGYSFWQIQNKTKEFECVGIFANKTFMVGYFSFIFACALLNTTGAVLNVLLI